MSTDHPATVIKAAAHGSDPSACHRSRPRKPPSPEPSQENGCEAAGPEANLGDKEVSPDRLRDFALHLSLTQEHERLRIAIGLHDQVGQTLAMLAGKLDELQEMEDLPQRTLAIAEMRALLARTIDATRALTFDLASPVLKQLGLEAALRGLGERLHRQHGIRFRFESGKRQNPAPGATDVIVYRCVRELLRNVVDHAGARHVTMRMTVRGDRLSVAVEDDGVGFDPSGLEAGFGPGGHFGLYSITEQLRLIGGQLDLDSAPGSGTRVVMVVPVDLETGRADGADDRGRSASAPTGRGTRS